MRLRTPRLSRAAWRLERPGGAAIAFAAWLLALFLLSGLLLDAPAAKSVLKRVPGAASFEAALKPFFAAAYRQ